MVRRRSTVRFRNGALIKDQVRSSLDSSHPTLRMGAVAVLGGIWEIASCAPPERLCRRARRRRATPRPRGNPLGGQLWSVGPAYRPQRTVLDDLPTPTDLKVADDRRA